MVSCSEFTAVGVEHLDLPLLREVYLGLVAHAVVHIAREAEAGVAHLEAPLPLLGLVFILAADGSVNVQCPLVLVLLCAGSHRYQERSRHKEESSHCVVGLILVQRSFKVVTLPLQKF